MLPNMKSSLRIVKCHDLWFSMLFILSALWFSVLFLSGGTQRGPRDLYASPPRAEGSARRLPAVPAREEAGRRHLVRGRLLLLVLGDHAEHDVLSDLLDPGPVPAEPHKLTDTKLLQNKVRMLTKSQIQSFSKTK